MPRSTKETRYISYLKDTIIPDFKESGREYTARDFRSMVSFLSGVKKSQGKTQEQFIKFLEETLIPDLKESGDTLTAMDFETGIGYLRKRN